MQKLLNPVPKARMLRISSTTRFFFPVVASVAFVLFVFTAFTTPAHAAPTSYYSYNDTILVVNDASATSTTIANYFMQARGLASTTWATTHVVHLSSTSTPTAEGVSLATFNTAIRTPVQNFLISHHLASTTNYIITTKGVPLTIGIASVDQELGLILGKYAYDIGSGYEASNPYFNQQGPFSSTKYGFYIVTRLTGYTIPQVEALINRSGNATTTNSGQFIFDTDPGYGYTCAQNCSYYYYNLDMEAGATSTLAKGYPTTIDYTNTYLTYQHNVLGYVSWGSNDSHAATTLTGWTDAKYLAAATTTFSIGLHVQATTTSTSGYVAALNTPAGGTDFSVNKSTGGTIVAGPQTVASSTWWQVAYVTGAIPHNTYVNGAIGATAVSTSGRTFTWPPIYGQSLIA
ncbi:MAG TPA: TIGR03790 family protein, partial [Candidatus Paceibacterota bacterium]|nr:TIGR03790 family protein [Candidatus Paceibacterota bacterium]